MKKNAGFDHTMNEQYNADNTTRSWYAAKVYHNKTSRVSEQLTADGVHHYVPDIIGSLVFMETDEEYLRRFEQQNFSHLWVYRHPGTATPTVIPDREMEMFLFVCTAGEKGLVYLGEDRPEYHQGDRVRVVEGPFKGAEGHIKRIKKDRRLVVTVSGVAAVATSFIPPRFLEILSTPPAKATNCTTITSKTHETTALSSAPN